MHECQWKISTQRHYFCYFPNRCPAGTKRGPHQKCRPAPTIRRAGQLGTSAPPRYLQSGPLVASGDGATPKRTKRRGGSGCGNGGTGPRPGSRGIGRVGPSVRKITRARNQKRPGTSGGGPKPEGEAPNWTASVGIRRGAVFPRGSAHEPPPENVARGRDVARSAAARRG